MGSSLIYPGEYVINDDSPEYYHAVPEGFGTGLDYSTRTEEGYAGVAEPFPTDLLIPKSEWQARIEEMESDHSRLSDIIIQAAIPSKNQAQTEYCWVNAPVGCMESVRAVQNEEYVELCPAAIGAQITNYQNRGGWGRQALEFLVAHGCPPASLWPENAIDPQYATPETLQIALNYRFDLWWFLDNSLEQIASCLLRRIPVSVGLGWWRHQVYYTDLVYVDGDFGVRFRNSWGPDWPTAGAGGWSILQGRKLYPDDSTAPRTAYAA